MLKLEFEKLVQEHSLSYKKLCNLLKKGVEKLQKREDFKNTVFDGFIRLVLVNDKMIKDLNREYRLINKPTDVLSFSYFREKKFPEADTVGEIIISLETAKKQAKQHKKSLSQEVEFLFVHGLLHIFGFDHEIENEKKIMFALQNKILE